MRRRHPELCGNDVPRHSPGQQYTQCPRCRAMALGAVSDTGEVFAADCVECRLPGLTSRLTLWNLKEQLALLSMPHHPGPVTIAEAVERMDESGWTGAWEVWQGDVKIAHYTPTTGDLHMYAGRCLTDGD